MAERLDSALSGGKLRLSQRTITNWVTELEAREGIADFVLTPTIISGSKLEWARRLASAISSPSVASVLATLNHRELTTREEICSRTSLASGTVGKAVLRLVEAGVVAGTVKEGVRLLRPIRESDIELWAYELKLRDWKHGMYQALQYRRFAHSVAIILPSHAASAVRRRLGQFRDYNVGVLIFDPERSTLRVLVRPRRIAPGSQAHYLFALATFMRRIRPAFIVRQGGIH